MVICKRCQSENLDPTRFCTFCGGRLPARVEPLTAARMEHPVVSPPVRSAPPRIDSAANARFVQKVVYQHFIKAKEYIRDRNLEAATREFRRALEVSPGEKTITSLLEKTMAAQKQAQNARRESEPKVMFRPASLPSRPPTPAGPAAPGSSIGPGPAARKPATQTWLNTFATAPALLPSMLLETPTHEWVTEIAVSAFILAGLGVFAALLLI